MFLNQIVSFRKILNLNLERILDLSLPNEMRMFKISFASNETQSIPLKNPMQGKTGQ